MRAAIQFLTILPVPAPNLPLGRATIWFPLVGALIGCAVAIAFRSPLQATAAIVVGVLLTGGLHEDGLADICDAVRGGRTRSRMLEILKDSRIGVYGAVAVTLSILVRWHAISRLPVHAIWEFVLAFAASRSAMVILAATTPPASEGLGSAFRQSLPAYAIPAVALQTAAIPFAVAGPSGWYALIAAAASILGVRLWLMRRLGGFTGDGLGFQCQITECLVLVVFAWR